MKAQERIARLEALLQRIGTRATEPRARRIERLSATAYDDIQDEPPISAAGDADGVRDAHAITDRHGTRLDTGSVMPKSFGSTGWTMPPQPDEAPPNEAKVTREMNAVKPGSDDGRVPNTRQLARQGMIPGMPPPPIIRESLVPALYTPEPERVPESEPPPISAPMFTPRPPSPPIEAAESYPFTGEIGTLVSRERPGMTLEETLSEIDPDALPEEYDMVEGVVEVEPDADDDAIRPSMLPRDAGFEEPQEITDVFESRSRLMSAPSLRPEELSELEILGEADAVEEAPISSRRAIPSPGGEPPESGPQVASLVPPAMASSPNSMEVVLPVAQSPGEYRPDLLHWTMPAPSLPASQPSRVPEIVRPLIDLEVNVAQAVGRTRAFQPATFGELLDATLDL